MSLDKITDYETTPADNVDVGNIGIAGSSSIRLGNDAIQTLMSHLAKVNAGTDPVADTWTFGDPSDLTKRIRLDAGNVTAGQTRVLDGNALSRVTFGQCRLALDSGSLKLLPHNGNLLTIDGVGQVVPSAGVTLAASGLTPGTLYRIYAYMNSGTMTLEASTTARATDSTTGVEIKSGDATRTLVGMAYCVTGPAWADSGAQRLVASWFNRRRRVAFKRHGSARSVASGSGTFSELSSSDRVEFVTWDSEILASYTGSANSDTAARGILTGLGIDGSAPTQFTTETYVETANQLAVVTTVYPASGLSEGYHYVSPYGGRTGDGTRTWSSAGGTSVVLDI